MTHLGAVDTAGLCTFEPNSFLYAPSLLRRILSFFSEV